jgi:hypothetical protein
VIGRNKTGTISLAIAFKQIGLTVGRQDVTERFADDWLVRDFRSLIKYCEEAQAFQDIPFSLNYTYIVMDLAFPGSKFILTTRDPEASYCSLVGFHLACVECGADLSLFEHADNTFVRKLKDYDYIRKGCIYDLVMDTYGLRHDVELYDRTVFKDNFTRYNSEVHQYFAHRTGDLLELDQSAERTTTAIVNFLGLSSSCIIDCPMRTKRAVGRPRGLAASPLTAHF